MVKAPKVPTRPPEISRGRFRILGVRKLLLKKSLASVGESAKDKGKLPEAMEVEGEKAKADGTNNSGKRSIPDYYLDSPEDVVIHVSTLHHREGHASGGSSSFSKYC